MQNGSVGCAILKLSSYSDRLMKGIPQEMSFNLEMQQRQIISEKMIESVNILQMTAQELGEYIDKIQMENPVIEIKEKKSDVSIDEKQWQLRTGEEQHYLTQRRNNDDYDPKDSWNYNLNLGETLKDYLKTQIVSTDLDDDRENILEFILDSLDDSGYLRESGESVAEYCGTTFAMADEMITLIRSLDPPGVAAANLQDCLEIQLERKGLLTDALKKIIEECLPLVAKNKIPGIAAAVGISAKQASEYCELIRSLDPRPGGRFAGREQTQYVIPDVLVFPDDQNQPVINGAVNPDIDINDFYQNMYDTSGDPEVKAYLEQKISQVKWIRRCVQQRSKTLLMLTDYILKNQEEFFVKGPGHLHPLLMGEAAQALDLNDSTISRTANRKFIQCQWGVFPLSYFFSRNVLAHQQSSSFIVGEAEQFTSGDIKKAIWELVRNEDKKKPLSDRAISEKLAERGMGISRRTVAKYREEEKIPDTRGRKEY